MPFYARKQQTEHFLPCGSNVGLLPKYVSVGSSRGRDHKLYIPHADNQSVETVLIHTNVGCMTTHRKNSDYGLSAHAGSTVDHVYKRQTTTHYSSRSDYHKNCTVNELCALVLLITHYQIIRPGATICLIVL